MAKDVDFGAMDNDIFVEQIIRKQKTSKEYAIMAGVIAGGLVLILLVMMIPLLRFFLAFIICGVGYGVWWMIISQNIEYEYSVTNGDIDIDQIIGKRRRRRVVSVGGSKIESFGRYSSAAFAGRKFDREVMAAPSPDADGVYYFTYHSKKNGHTVVLFQPDERVRAALVKGLPNLLQIEYRRQEAGNTPES